MLVLPVFGIIHFNYGPSKTESFNKLCLRSVHLLAFILQMLLTGSYVFSPLTPVLYVTEAFTLSAGIMKLSFDLTLSLRAP